MYWTAESVTTSTATVKNTLISQATTILASPAIRPLKKLQFRQLKSTELIFQHPAIQPGLQTYTLSLKKALAFLREKQDAVVFASGFQGNTILLDILKDRYSAVFCDRNVHASILAGIPGGVESVIFYDHCDATSLENLLKLSESGPPLVITDGVFALTGEIAPLDRIYPVVKKYNGILVVDDAHSTGILGKTGKGTPEHFNLPEDENVFQTETMSKALGGYGGFISGNTKLTNLIREKSATYQASTALPPPIAAAGIASLKVIQENPGLRLHALENAAIIRDAIIGMGFRTAGNGTPIIPVIFDSSAKASGLSWFLEEQGIIAPFMNYPVKVEMHQIRITVSAIHTNGQIEFLSDMLHQWKKKYGND